MKKYFTPHKRSIHLPVYLLLLFPFLFSTGEAKGEPKTLLYKISGNGLSQDSYLYGTIHLGDKKILNFKKPVMEAFKSCKVYAMELDPGTVDPMALMEQMKLKEGTLQDMFSEEEWQQIDQYFQENFKTSASDFNDFSPFYVQSMILQAKMGSKTSQAVDMHFYNLAKKRFMKVVGIETIEEQLAAVTGLSKDAQKYFVLSAIEDDYKEQMEAMIKIYRKGDLQALQSISDEEETGEDFEKKMVNDRNRVMAERIEPLIKDKSTFIGVGALHLPGEVGVINLLREAGYQVEPIK